MSALLLWNVAWSAALAVGVFCVGRLPALRRRPAMMHFLWFGVLLRLVVPAVIAIPVLPDAAATVRVEADFTNAVPRNVSIAFVPVEVAQPREPVESVEPPLVSRAKAWALFDVGLAASLAGTALLLIASAIRCLRLLRLKSASDDAPDHLNELAAQLAGERKLCHVPKLRIVDGLATPSLWGLGRRATILLPRHLVDDFDGDQWSCILAHELAHVVRGDVWFNLAAAGVLHLFWWNPVAWWAYREMRAAQEASCDALALSQSSASRRRYAETLLRVVDSWNRPSLVQPHVVLGFGTRSVLTRRFEMIADASVRPRTAVVTLLCLVAGSLSFFCDPIRADKDEPVAAQDKAPPSRRELKKDANEAELVDFVLTAQRDNAKKYPQGLLDADVEFYPGKHKSFANVEVIWSPKGTYWNYSLTSRGPDGQESQNRGEIIKNGNQSIFYSPAGKLVQITQTDIFGLHPEIKIRPSDIWFHIFQIEVPYPLTKFLDPKVNADILSKYVIKENDKNQIIVERHYKVGGYYTFCISRDHGDNIVSFDTVQEKGQGVWHRGRFEWEQLPTGEWYVKSLKHEVSVTGNPDQIDGTFILKVNRFIPSWDIPANRFSIESLNLPAETKYEEYGADGQEIRRDKLNFRETQGDNSRLQVIAANDAPKTELAKTADSILKYDDGKPDGKKSIAGTGQMIRFVAPEQNLKLKSLRLHCARYGTSKAPNEDVDVSIVSDDEATVLHTELVPYSRFKRGESRWTMIEFKEPVEVPEKFWIVVDFNAEQTKGVYLSFDTSSGGKHSKIGVPGGESKPVTTGGDWMIQSELIK